MEYRNAIVDECGTIRHWMDELTEVQAEEILNNHPEWHTRCMEV